MLTTFTYLDFVLIHSKVSKLIVNPIYYSKNYFINKTRLFEIYLSTKFTTCMRYAAIIVFCML